jgi:hypothetical protein
LLSSTQALASAMAICNAFRKAASQHEPVQWKSNPQTISGAPQCPIARFIWSIAPQWLGFDDPDPLRCYTPIEASDRGIGGHPCLFVGSSSIGDGTVSRDIPHRKKPRRCSGAARMLDAARDRMIRLGPAKLRMKPV